MVLFVYGFGVLKLVMSVIRWKLDKIGYCIYNWGYFSMWYYIDKNVDCLVVIFVLYFKDWFLFDIYFVIYSLGGILIRVVFVKYSFKKLCRIVMFVFFNWGFYVVCFVVFIFGWMCVFLKEFFDVFESFVYYFLDFWLFKEIEFGIIEVKWDVVVILKSVKFGG